MKTLALPALSLIAALSVFVGPTAKAGVFDLIPSRTGNYCKDEALEFIERRFPGIEVKSVLRYGQSREWQFWMRSDVCPGYFVFNFDQVEVGNCTTPQYWKRTLFMTRVWGYGACEETMPHQEYPYGPF